MQRSNAAKVREVLVWLERRGTKRNREGMARYGIHAARVFGVSVTGDEPFMRSLVLVEGGAFDERNFVKKGVSWALRSIGRRTQALNAAAVEVSRRLAASPDAAARWVGKDALRELTSPAVRRRLAARQRDPRRPAPPLPA